LGLFIQKYVLCQIITKHKNKWGLYMSDKSIAELLRLKNAKNIAAYQKDVKEYNSASEAGAENLKPPIMDVTVGGIKFNWTGKEIAPENQETVMTKLQCPEKGIVDAINNKIKSGANISEFSTSYDLNQINVEQLDKVLSVSPLPITIIDRHKVTHEEILGQCINNYEAAGEAAKLPRKPLGKPVRGY
jgi:hypothetical protein